MKSLTILISPNKLASVKIEKGELISYTTNGEELIHQKGALGWQNSDTEMFPIIGSTSATNYKVATPKGIANQDQHGILRELGYHCVEHTFTSALFQKEYNANTKVNNSKFPEKSSVSTLCWPYSFSVYKKYELTNTSLVVTFKITAEAGMPFMFGYHPAFKLSGNNTELCNTDTKKIPLQKIIDSGAAAYALLNTNALTLTKKSGTNIRLKTSGFAHFMLWTPVTNMLCIEPITAYPLHTAKGEIKNDLFSVSKGTNHFTVEIIPF